MTPWARRGWWLATCAAAAAAGVLAALAVRSGARLGAPGLPGFPLPQAGELEAPVREALAAALVRVKAGERDAAAWGRLGMLCQAHGLLEEACRAYERAEGLAPRDGRWPHLRGLALQRLSRSEEAAGALRRAIEIDPRDAVAACTLARLLEDRGEDEDARRLYLRALEADSGCAAARVGLGQLAARAGADDAAVKSLELALEAEPRCGPAHSALAAFHARAGKAREAELHRRLGRALGTRIPLPDPLSDEVTALGVSYAARIQRGRLAGSAGRWEEAAEHLRAAASLRPRLAEPRRPLGTSLLAAGKAGEAAEELLAAASLEGDEAEAWTQAARAHAARGDLAKAREAVARALEAEPRRPEALVVRGKLRAQEGDRAAAIADFEAGAAVDPASPAGHLALGQLLLEPGPDVRKALGDPEVLGRERGRALRALDAFERAIERKADLPEAYEGSALAGMQLRELAAEPEEKRSRLQAALERLGQLVRVFPERKDGHVHWIRALHAAGMEKEALEAIRRAHKLWPADPRFREAARPPR
ncbi:MAG: tetratricopeptide repeat protein [Planctomycetes bacterium]|nr:tetratricopeptide repeat protein [Planctomycetota bacterium]